MAPERIQLRGAERLRYFAPTMICVYLAALCAILIVTSAFLTRMQDAVAVTAAGLFGLLLSGGLGFAFWWSQRRDLLYLLVPTSSDPRTNFQAVRAAVHDAGWLILREDPARRLEAQAIGSSMNPGERVAVQFRDNDVLIASICDPSVGFSLVGRRRCREHRELVRRAVLSARQE